ncbi:MAG: hemerythrin domain-containing protein [Burkholderiaceae bacterium]
MNFERQVCRQLDDEHRAHLALLDQLEHVLAHTARGSAAPADAEAATLMRRLDHELTHNVQRHFAFEEGSLFPRLADNGDGGMAELLMQEHEVIREVAAELQPLVQTAAAGTLDAPGWQTLAQTALELVERQVSHIQKETMALLPLLDELLDAEADRELALAYAES